MKTWVCVCMILAFIIPSTLHALDAQKFDLAYTLAEASVPKEDVRKIIKAGAPVSPEWQGGLAKVVATGKAKGLPEAYVNAYIGMLKEGFLQTWDIVIKGEEFDEYMRKLYVKMALVYEHNFSQEELKQLLQFYASPTGKKLLATWPSVMKVQSEMGDAAEKTLGPSLKSNLERIIAQKTSDLEKKGKLPKNFDKNFE